MKRLGVVFGFLLIVSSVFSVSIAASVTGAVGSVNFVHDVEHPKILLLSSLVDHAELLAGAASEEVLVLRYDPRETSLEELEGRIRETLRGRKAASIAFATHDHGENKFYLTSSETVSLPSTLANEAQREFWRKMGSLITDDGRVDLLACNLASGDNGKLLLASLEEAPTS